MLVGHMCPSNSGLLFYAGALPNHLEDLASLGFPTFQSFPHFHQISLTSGARLWSQSLYTGFSALCCFPIAKIPMVNSHLKRVPEVLSQLFQSFSHKRPLFLPRQELTLLYTPPYT